MIPLLSASTRTIRLTISEDEDFAYERELACPACRAAIGFTDKEGLFLRLYLHRISVERCEKTDVPPATLPLVLANQLVAWKCAFALYNLVVYSQTPSCTRILLVSLTTFLPHVTFIL